VGNMGKRRKIFKKIMNYLHLSLVSIKDPVVTRIQNVLAGLAGIFAKSSVAVMKCVKSNSMDAIARKVVLDLTPRPNVHVFSIPENVILTYANVNAQAIPWKMN